MASIRQEKISNLVKRELALIFQQESRNLFAGRFITVTQVRVSPDLSLAKAYLSIMAVPDAQAELKKINEQKWKIKQLLVKQVGRQLRRMPDLAFFLDDSLDYFDEISDLLKK